MAQLKEKKYLPAIDILRILAILAVILIHTTSRSLQDVNFHIFRVPLTLYMDQLARFAVPLFFMISGFVLEYTYAKKLNFFLYFKKRVNRILIPYIVWSFVYYFFVYTSHKKNFFQALVYGDASYQLYFIPSLIIFYFLFPFIHSFSKYIFNKWTFPVIVLSQLYFLYYDYAIHSYSYSKPVKTTLLNYGIFLVGICIAKYHEPVFQWMEKWKVALLTLTLALAYFVFYEGEINYVRTNNYLSFWSQWRPSVFFYAFFLFGSVYVILQKFSVSEKTIQYFSRLSFFVFFIHVFILETLWRTVLHPMVLASHTTVVEHLWYDPMVFIFVASLSFLIAAAVHKIPYAAKITG